MSSSNIEAEKCCALCGVAEVDDTKLKECDGCDLVRYCSDECQQDHGPEHEEACKKRAAVLRDEILFRKPESNHPGDCLICCLPIPIGNNECVQYSCCSKVICNGCSYASQVRQERVGPTCPFCRHALPRTREEVDRNNSKRAEANDPFAMRKLGETRYHEGDYEGAFIYWTKASELGEAMSHYNLSILYKKGEGVETDEKKEVHHLEEAAIAGYPQARNELAFREGKMKRFDRAVKHWMINANLGHDESLKALKSFYKFGYVSKDDFAAALRAYHAAVKATKSPQRDAAAKAVRDQDVRLW